MLKNKRGISDVVMTVIMIVLVLIAVGVVWVTVQGILTKNAANIDVGQKCIGLGFEITGMACPLNDDQTFGNKCFVEITRSAGSAGEGIEGVGLTFTQLTTTSEELYSEGNIAVSKRIEMDLPLDIEGVPVFDSAPGKVDARFYFNKAGGEKYFCPTTATFTA